VAGVSGNGTLATVEFRAKTLGSCTLDLYDTKLVNSAKQLMNHSEVDGTVTASGCVVIKVQYLDGCPRSDANVWIHSPIAKEIGTTVEDGRVTNCDLGLSGGTYWIHAYYPSGTLFGPYNNELYVDSNGDGTATIQKNIEITPPAIAILSPKNLTYCNSSVPLTFTIYDYSSISWIGYSLDGQANTTITGNTTLTNLSIGSHNIVVYSNDTYGNMGSSEKVYFTREPSCVTIRVQYLDGFPRANADVIITAPEFKPFGITNESGLTTRYDYLDPETVYQVKAYWGGSQFGGTTPFMTDEYGNGYAQIHAHYEITPPVIEILSPQNVTYTDGSVPLTFTVYDFSVISWIGYSLDGQANVTITGNTTLTNLTIGQHSINVYANDTYGNMGSSDKIYFTIANDIAVTNVAPAKTIVGQGYSMSINVTVENQGAFEVTFNVTVYANATSIATQTITLTSRNSTTITFTWNTTGFAKGNYTISAYVWPVPGETYTEDNTLPDGWVIVTIPGDVNGDRLVDISDLVITVGAIPSAPGWLNWNSNADINGDGVCDISDLVICIGNIPSSW